MNHSHSVFLSLSFSAAAKDLTTMVHNFEVASNESYHCSEGTDIFISNADDFVALRMDGLILDVIPMKKEYSPGCAVLLYLWYYHLSDATSYRLYTEVYFLDGNWLSWCSLCRAILILLPWKIHAFCHPFDRHGSEGVFPLRIMQTPTYWICDF